MFLAVGLLLAADDAKKGDVKKDKEALQGAWRPVSAERGGQAQDDAKEYLLIFEGDNFTIKRGDDLFAKGTYTIDPSKKPRTIDMTITEGRNENDKGKAVRGIYAIEDGKLKWCTAAPGDKERPGEFATKEGTSVMLIVLKKEKP
jgi:uncharacterized protein (TIGR03067 family)